jgi:hypothetical protein
MFVTSWLNVESEEHVSTGATKNRVDSRPRRGYESACNSVPACASRTHAPSVARAFHTIAARVKAFSWLG